MKTNYLFILFVLTTALGFTQTKDSLSIEEKERREKNIQAGNPFKEFGYKAKIATLSKGKYLEFHDLDSIVQVGSVMINTKTNKIVTIIEKDTLPPSEATLKPEIISRWMSPDPLSEEFPDKSPYNFVNNNPLRFIDPLGLAPEDLILKGSKKDLAQVASNIDASLGKGATSIDKNGKVTLNVSRDDLKTDGQKAFYDTLDTAISNDKDTVIGVVSGDNSITAGSYSGEVIDISDINAFGEGEGANQNSILGHEVTEQFEKQVNGAERPEAHAAGERAEASITGYTRVADDKFNETSRSKVTQRVTNQYGRTRTRTNITTSGVGGFNYTNGTSNIKVQYTTKNKNIIKVDRVKN